jgi:hypothetical protein
MGQAWGQQRGVYEHEAATRGSCCWPPRQGTWELGGGGGHGTILASSGPLPGSGGGLGRA